MNGDDALVLYFDGACEPRNPGGIACYGWLVKRDGATLASGHGEATRGPGATNNVAEYAALIAGLEALAGLDLDGEPVQVRGDSRLVINQVAGRWQVKSPNLRPLHGRARSLVRRLQDGGCRVTLRWVPRDQNAEADALSRKAYRAALQGGAAIGYHSNAIDQGQKERRIMPFQKMQPALPPRLWALVGRPGSGKSTFGAQMKAPILAIDSDHRFREVLHLVDGDVYQLSDEPTDNVNSDAIARILGDNMPGSDVETIVVDSLTSIVTPLVVEAMSDKDAGRVKNLAAAFRKKALAMRQLQDGITRWGCDVLWIYHLLDARDEKAKAVTRATISQTELARLVRSINLQLEIVRDGPSASSGQAPSAGSGQARRGVKVKWARRGRSGMVLWDDTDRWAGMPEKIEQAVYGGLTRAEQERIERATPAVFPNPETAIAWGYEQGAFEALTHARNAYEKVRREKKPKTAREMTGLWVGDVQARLDEKAQAELPS